jgi:hypothetical protein
VRAGSGRGSERDERRVLIDLRASAFAFHVVVIVSLTMTFIGLARGHWSGTWAIVTAVVGGAYIAGIVVFSRRG